MNEVLYNFAALSKQDRWRELAERFNRQRIFNRCGRPRQLQGLHVNTTIPQVIGAARGYELTGAANLHDCAEYFWHTVIERRTYCTGGTSNGESWNSGPDELAKELSGYTQECCVTYNLQKLTRQVFCWTADPRAADYYERAYYNGILGVQHPADGSKLYYVPLSGYKLFGTSMHDFWCCTGSMAGRSRARRQYLFQRRRWAVREPVRAVGSDMAGERAAHRAKHDVAGERSRDAQCSSDRARAQLRIRVPY